MQRAAPAVEQARLARATYAPRLMPPIATPRARSARSHLRDGARRPRMRPACRRTPAADRAPRASPMPAVHRDVDAVARAHRSPVAREQPPLVQLLAAQAIGGSQRLDRRRERHHRELRDQKETDDGCCGPRGRASGVRSVGLARWRRGTWRRHAACYRSGGGSRSERPRAPAVPLLVPTPLRLQAREHRCDDAIAAHTVEVEKLRLLRSRSRASDSRSRLRALKCRLRTVASVIERHSAVSSMPTLRRSETRTPRDRSRAADPAFARAGRASRHAWRPCRVVQFRCPVSHHSDVLQRAGDRDHVLTAHRAAQPAETFVQHEARQPRRQRAVAAESAHCTESRDVGVLQRILRLGFIAQRRARKPVQPSIVAPHHRFEGAAVAALHALDERALVARTNPMKAASKAWSWLDLHFTTSVAFIVGWKVHT